MTLRDYQQECLETIKSRYLSGIRRQLTCLPTGSGKTVIFSAFPAYFQMKNQMLVLAHRSELLDQARDKIQRINPELRVEVEQAGRVELSPAPAALRSRQNGDDTSCNAGVPPAP